MKKLLITLIVTVLLSLVTAVLVFADIDGPPPGVSGCDISDDARGDQGSGVPLPTESPHCFPHNTPVDSP